MKTNSKKTVLVTAVALVILYALMVALDAAIPASSYWAMLLTVIRKGAVYALVAVSMNLLNGFTGLFSLGQAGFMLLGAYTYAIFTIPVEARAGVYQYYDGGLIQFAIPWPLALVLAGVVAAGFAFLIGLPVLRLKSDYLAIATLGFAEIIRAVFQWDKLGPVTNGANALKNFPTFSSFNIKDASGAVVLRLSTFVAFLLAAICIAVILLLINSSYGRAFKAIREDEVAAEAMGINLAKHKRLSFCISSFFAGVGGGMFAMFANQAQAKNFTTAMTYEILLIVVIGGIGSISGSCIASFLYVAASEWLLRFLDSETVLNSIFGFKLGKPFKVPFLRNGFRMVAFSVVIMIVVLFFRKGIMGDKELPDLFRRRKKSKTRAKGGEG